MTDASPAATVKPALDIDRPVVAFGVTLLSSAVLISSWFSRARPHLDASTYAVGVLATLALLAVAVAAYLGLVVSRGADGSTDLVAWPGSFGAVAAGVMVVVGLAGSEASQYAAGLVMVSLAVLGYAGTRRGAFLVPAIGGFFVVWFRLFQDVVGARTPDGDFRPTATALALTLFAVLATAACWRLRARVFGGVVVGAITVFSFAEVAQLLWFGPFPMFMNQGVQKVTVRVLPAEFTWGSARRDWTTMYRDDAWVVLALALLLALMWAACAAVTRHVGFRLLVPAMALAVFPNTVLMRLLGVDHPTWWGVGFAVVGGGTLVAVAVRNRRLATT